MNKEKFITLFNNKVIKLYLFNQIKSIHKFLELEIYKWNELLYTPTLSLAYKYYDLFKEYFKDYNSSTASYYELSIRISVKYSISKCEFDTLNYLRDELGINLENYIDEAFYLSVVSKSNRLDQLQYLDSLNLKIPETRYQNYFFRSMSTGCLDTVRWFGNKITDANFNLPLHYFSNIQLDVLLYIFTERQQHIQWYDRNELVENILSGGKTEILEYMFNAKYILSNQISINISNLAHRGALNAIKWVYGNADRFYAVNCNEDAIDYACKLHSSANERIELVKWLHENTGVGCTTQAMDNAAHHDLQLVIWLHENRTEGCTTDAMDIAFRKERLDIVKWLHANRTEGCSECALESTLYNGNLEMLKWIRENFPTGKCTNGNEFTISPEIYSCVNSVEMLKYIDTFYIEQISAESFGDICATGNLELVRYIAEEHQPTRRYVNEIWDDALTQSFYSENINVVKYVIENQSSNDGTSSYISDLPTLISNNVNDEIIQLIINKQMCSWEIRGIAKAVKLGRFGLAKWLYEVSPQFVNVKEEIGEVLIKEHQMCKYSCMCLPYILRFEESISKFQ